MITGSVRPGGAAVALAPDTARVFSLALPASQRLVRVAAYIDTEPGVQVPQPVRAVIHTADGVLLARSDERVVQPATPAGWLSFDFGDIGRALPEGPLWVGLHAGGTVALIRMRVQDGSGQRFDGRADTYADGTANFSAAAPIAGFYFMLLETLTAYAPPAGATDQDLARLPWELSQRAFAGGSSASTRMVARAGWHGPLHDEEQGAVAIARTGGPLEELVGQRLRVITRSAGGEHSVSVLLYNEESWPDDITDEDVSLTLRAWLELASPAASSIEVEVEVIP